MRLRRSLFFVAPATSAGRPSRRQPGETVKALPGRYGRGGCGLPGAPKLPQAAAPEARSCCRTKLCMMRGRYGRTSFGPGASRARLGRKSCVGMAVRFAVGAQGLHNKKPPPGPPHPPPSHGFPATISGHIPVYPGILFAKSRLACPELPGSFLLLACSLLRGIARLKILPLSKCPRTVRRSRSASRRAPFAAAPVALRAPTAAAHAKGTHAEKGERSILHKQGNFLYCVDTPAGSEWSRSSATKRTSSNTGSPD